MLMADFERGIERLIGNWGEKSISPGLIRELQNRYFIRDARIWDQMITLVLDRCRYAPRMSNFREVMESMKNDVARNSNHASSRWCGNCMKGFLEKHILSRGMPYVIMVPCSCHPCPPKQYEENEYIGERIAISKEEYDERWAEIREKREKKGKQRPDRTGDVWSAKIPPSPQSPNLTNQVSSGDLTEEDERTSIQAVEAIEEKESTPPDTW